ncbi:MAG: hypothetical protein ACI9MR_000351, partial [Myxococcota bacterium]
MWAPCASRPDVTLHPNGSQSPLKALEHTQGQQTKAAIDQPF